MGSGDPMIATSGAEHEQLQIPSVLFLDRILIRLQTLLAQTPGSNAITARHLEWFA